MSPSSDHHATLKGFAAWRESLPPAERLGIWQLLTACYGEGVQGLSYEAVRLQYYWNGYVILKLISGTSQGFGCARPR